jgi:prepilin-type N-terminal cleavage/methylation domain-containing protein
MSDDLMKRHRGATLLELIVVLVVLGITTSVAAVTLSRSVPDGRDTARDSIADARRRAAMSGISVTIIIAGEGSANYVTAYPDGRVSGAEHLGISPVTGRSIPLTGRSVKNSTGG